MNFIQISSFVWIFADKEHQLKIASVYTSSTFEIPLNQKLTFTEALSVIKKSAQEFKAQFKKVTEDTIFSGVDVIESSGAMGNVAARLVQYIQ